jgi:hypothetical protein
LTSPECFKCYCPAGNEYAGRYSAYCAECQPVEACPAIPGRRACQCPRCGENFPDVAAFDEHAYPVEAGSGAPLRSERRTSVVVMGPDTIRVCDPECRNEVLSDLGIPGRGKWKYRGRGEASVTVAWSGKSYDIAWKRCRPSALPCDACGDGWMGRIPGLVADAQRRSDAMRESMPTALVPFS